jgi:hypothetical protein
MHFATGCGVSASDMLESMTRQFITAKLFSDDCVDVDHKDGSRPASKVDGDAG